MGGVWTVTRQIGQNVVGTYTTYGMNCCLFLSCCDIVCTLSEYCDTHVQMTSISCFFYYHLLVIKLFSDVLSFLKTCLPTDGFCIVGLTWVDLYPGEEWNFVLGESSCLDGCAVVSFGHFEPQSYRHVKSSLMHEDRITLDQHNTDTQNISLDEERDKMFSFKTGVEDFASLTEIDEKIIWRLLRVS